MSRILLLPVLALLAAPLAEQAPPARSAAWESSCSVCHGEDGRSRTEEGRQRRARDLTDPTWQAAVSDRRLAASIRRGRDRMPAFGRKLTDGQIRALVAEIRGLARKGP